MSNLQDLEIVIQCERHGSKVTRLGSTPTSQFDIIDESGEPLLSPGDESPKGNISIGLAPDDIAVPIARRRGGLAMIRTEAADGQAG